jgi:hypothetical protein
MFRRNQPALSSTRILALLTICFATAGLAQPVISTQPRDQGVPRGGSTTLSVQVEGELSQYQYQWFFNSTNNAIANATNTTLVFSNAITADEGNYLVRVSRDGQVAWSRSARLTVFPRGLGSFGTITLPPAFQLDGAGTDVDSIAFWEAPNPTNTLLFVTAKGNDLVEVWQFPFQGNERRPLSFTANVNGVDVDQKTDLLYVTDSIVSVFSLPSLQPQGTFGSGIIGLGENNIDLLEHTNGQTWIYVSEDHRIHRFEAASRTHLGLFAPTVSSIETLLADAYYQMILVPEEQGPGGSPGIYAYHPDGTPFLKDGTNRFGSSGIIDSDEEGILLYTFPPGGDRDNGAGFIVISDQRSDVTDFEFFDRQTWGHLGTLRLQGVSNTDGIASTQRSMPGYPLGLFAAINNDTTTAALGWDVILQAVGFNPHVRVLRITPRHSTVSRGQELAFMVEFSEPVTNFNDAADLLITHFGTTNTGVTISGSNTLYGVTLTGISGRGEILISLNLESDVANFKGEAVASTVTSMPVIVGSPYQAWAAQHGLIAGLNDLYSADPDNDQRPNLVEFATDGDPLSPSDARKERLALEEIGATLFLTYTFPVRDGAVFGGTERLSATVNGVSYTLSGSVDLTNFNQRPVEIAPPLISGLPEPNSGWIYRTFGLEQSLVTPAARYLLRELDASH